MKTIATHKLLLAALVLAASCKPSTPPETEAKGPFLDLAGRDTSVRAQDDFFTYANGAWFNQVEIPADQTGWGSFYTLYEENQKKTRLLLEEVAAAKAPKGSVEQKVGDYYAAAMDTMTIEKLGYDPIKSELAKVDAIKTVQDLLDFIATQEYNRGGAFIGINVYPDDRRSDINRLNLTQAGTGLPEKDYYFKKDGATKAIRDAYVKYMVEIFTLTGETDQAKAGQRAAAILKLETEIAKSHKSPVELRDPIANYHKYVVADLNKETPNINWTNFMSKMGIKTDTILVGQPAYYKSLSTLLKSTPIEVLKDKLRFSLVDDAANYLSSPFVHAKFNFYKILTGQPELQERWKRAAAQTDNHLGELLGQLWVKKYFPPDAKARMLTMVNNLQIVYKKRIEQLDWMSPETKQKALAKLNAFLKKIGYPDQWEDYSDVTISRDNYYQNVLSAQRHVWNKNLKKVEQKVDKNEWQMTPPTVNAYYNPSFNEIVFPAGILQSPFFNFDADDAINYGGIGAVIGHEMTHGFDDQGSQYDADGNLTEWWTKQDRERFTERAGIVVSQYNGFKVLDSLNVNGQLTLGENIADLGGITLAYEAFKLTEQGKSDEKIDGYTPDQRFFMSWANVWRIKDRPEQLRMRINVDPHSPEQFRTNGPLMNFEPFYQAFGVKEGDKMYLLPKDSAKIW
ncbi:MAG: M13 family metallopeptidase [Saprospiraceae bacterium]|nr:M13 family metallopeptidase [Saprospiraceae bacterium]